MRILRKKDGGQRREAVERVRFTEPNASREASDPKSGLMLLGEKIADATTS